MACRLGRERGFRRSAAVLPRPVDRRTFKLVVSVLAILLVIVIAACGAEQPGHFTNGSATMPRSKGPPLPDQAAGAPDWRIAHLGPHEAIEAFANRTSVLPGEPVTLFVSTTAKTFTATAYRVGDYVGAEVRQVWKSPPWAGHKQATAEIRKPTNTIVAPWQPTLTVDTNGWLPGDYLFRLDADNGAQRFVPITLRTPSNVGRIVIVNAVTTWQAYNRWGGYSLYQGPSGARLDRSRAVSFDRPYQADTMQGAGDFLYFELPFVLFAERSGLPLGYATDVDLHSDPHLLDGARAMVTLGHDEYWSAAMRNNTARARDDGVNLAFLGGNEIYRHIRLDPTAIGANRLEIDYKAFANDPYSKTDPLDATPEWRSPPYPRPESVLLGNFYQCNPVKADLVVADADNWLLKGIVSNGQKLPNLVGNEYEQVDLSVPTPRPIQVLLHSPVTCQHKSGFADASYYTAPGGAAVFSAGTQYWICGLDPRCTTSQNNAAIRRITQRLLDAFAQGPTGIAHPAVDNLAALHIRGATPKPIAAMPSAIVPTH